jgi:hypothetical protein
LREGQIVHAEHQGRTGEPAVASILAMPAGTLGTTALPSTIPQTVTRDLQEVLLGALRSLDETNARREVADDDFDAAFDMHGDEVVETEPTLPPHTLVLQRTREIEGYLAACMFLASNGGVVCHDGSIDLRPATSLTAEAMRLKQKTIDEMGIDDEAEDLLITSTNQYHLLRRLHSEVPAFIYLVLDRNRSNPIMAKLALENAVRSLDRQ